MKKLLAVLLCTILSFFEVTAFAEKPINRSLLLKPVAPIYNEVIINSISEEKGPEMQVSHFSVGPSDITVEFARSVSASYSTNLDYSIEAKLFDLASVKTGASIGRSFSVGQSYSEKHNFHIASGLEGAVYFAPLFKVVHATYFDNDGYATKIVAKYPMELDGHANGSFFVKYR